ncbi:MAG TPA: hypothetical protein VJJ22_02615 [Candidatus Paceibacterota bacterium]
MSKIIVVKPAVHKIDGLRWHWTYLPDLAQILGISPLNVLASFGALASPRYYGDGLWEAWDLSWYDPIEQEFHKNSNNNVFPSCGDIYVPAGWTNDVLKVWGWGVRYTVRNQGLEVSGDGLLRWFQTHRYNWVSIQGFTNDSKPLSLIGQKQPYLGVVR